MTINVKKLERVFLAAAVIFCLLCSEFSCEAANESVSSSADLSGLTLNCGTLSPAFDPNITAYTVDVYGIVSMLIMPVASDTNSTITINGTPCQSGSYCKVSLSLGTSAINIIVTTEDGLTKCYILTVSNASSAAAGLDGLAISSGTLSPTFATDTLSYSAGVENSVTSVTLIPTALDTTQTITINGEAVGSGCGFAMTLSTGANSAVITVSVAGGSSKTYTVTVTRAQGSSTAGLSGLAISPGTLSPAFATDTLSYSASVENSVTLVTLIPTALDSAQAITVNGEAVTSGCGFALTLSVGTNSAVITVLESTGGSKTYLVTVTRAAASSSAGLSSLIISSGTLSPAFATDTLSYTASVEYSVTSVTLTPTAAGASQTITVNGKTVSGGAGFALALSVGANSAVITVSVAAGSSKTYAITVTRAAASSSAGLSSLTISSGTLSPTFAADTLSYTASVKHSVSSVTLTPTAAGSSQTITINGEAVSSGRGFALALSVGANSAVITVSVTGSSSRTYAITVTRAAASSSPGLSSLVISSGSLDPCFSSNILSYTASVENSVTKLYISATATDTSETVKINGGTSSYASLTVGENTVTITVTAADETVKTYTVSVFRKYETEISITSQNADGAYCATVPDYVTLFDDSDAFTFNLGDDTIVIPVSTLKDYEGSGTLTVSRSDSSQSTVLKAASLSSSNCTIAGGVDICLSGGSATTICSISASATLEFKSGVKTVLKEGVPEIYYYNKSSGTLVDTNAVFDMTAGTATFTASFSGTYVFAVTLPDSTINYTLTADPTYSGSGSSRTFGVKITRGSDSIRLSNAQLLVVTTHSSGSQTFSFIELTGNDCSLTVKADTDAVQSTIYLIKGTFDGTAIPKTYALTQFVSG